MHAGWLGHLALKANQYYWMKTPVLGEVDFERETNGCLKIDIFDIIRAASAYDSQGIAVPDINWFSGADLAPPAGIVDIFDIVTVAAKYGTEWNCPPPCP